MIAKTITAIKELTSKIELDSVIFILITGLLFRLIVALYLYPGYDEAYYYLYSKHLDWSYFDHPVLVALTTGLGVWLTGEVSQFTIRLGTLLIHTVNLLILYIIAKKLFNQSTALLTLTIASLIPIFQIAFGVLTLPDVPLIFFWSLTLLCAVSEFFSPSQSRYVPSYRLSILGVLIALACLSKYHGFILGLGIAAFCATTPQYRRVFRSHWLWLGLLLFLLTLFPLWYWNFQHDWVSFRFQLSGRFQPGNLMEAEEASSIYRPIDVIFAFLAGVGYLFPSFGFPLWWVTGKALRAQLSPGNVNLNLQCKQRLILWVSLPLTVGFTLLGGKTQILPTWPMAGFWSLTLILGYYADKGRKYGAKTLKNWLLTSGIAIYTLLLLCFLHLTTGLLQKPNQYPFFNGLVSANDDPSTELIDVGQLRQKFAASATFRGALANSDFIFTNAYYLGGYIGMAIAPLADLPIACFSDDRRGFMFWTAPEDLIGKNGLYITSQRFFDRRQLNQEYRDYFQSLEEVMQIPLRRAGQITEIFYVYRGKNLLEAYEPKYAQKQPTSRQ